MPTRAGAHADRVQRARELLATKGRREYGRFTFEGPTLLNEALQSGVAIDEIYATDAVFDQNPALEALETRGIEIAIVDDRTARKLSDLDTPTGLVAVAPMRFASVAEILGSPLSLVLADLNDPGNAGTLLRSAEAFGAGGVLFGRFGVDPYHPKVVRSAMGAIFRLNIAVASPEDAESAAVETAATFYGLTADGDPITEAGFTPPSSIVVGHERQGLGTWERLCSRRLAIPMQGPTESLNAAVAGSIALYEASRRP